MAKQQVQASLSTKGDAESPTSLSGDVKNIILSTLGAEFPMDEVRSRDGGRGLKLDYIDIVSTIKRLSNVLDTEWDWTITHSSINVVDGHTDRNGNPIYIASVRGQLNVTMEGLSRPAISRGGVGADKDSDPDKAIKTADAEALKKAGHKYLIALYLWDEEKRNEIHEFRKKRTSRPRKVASAKPAEAAPFSF